MGVLLDQTLLIVMILINILLIYYEISLGIQVVLLFGSNPMHEHL